MTPPPSSQSSPSAPLLHSPRRARRSSAFKTSNNNNYNNSNADGNSNGSSSSSSSSSDVHVSFDMIFRDVHLEDDTLRAMAALADRGKEAQLPHKLLVTWRLIGRAAASTGGHRSGITRPVPLVIGIGSNTQGDDGSSSSSHGASSSSSSPPRLLGRMYSWQQKGADTTITTTTNGSSSSSSDDGGGGSGVVHEQCTLQCRLTRRKSAGTGTDTGGGDDVSNACGHFDPMMVKFKLNKWIASPSSREEQDEGGGNKKSRKRDSVRLMLMRPWKTKPYRRLAEVQYDISQCCTGNYDPSLVDVALPMTFRVPITSVPMGQQHSAHSAGRTTTTTSSYDIGSTGRSDTTAVKEEAREQKKKRRSSLKKAFSFTRAFTRGKRTAPDSGSGAKERGSDSDSDHNDHSFHSGSGSSSGDEYLEVRALLRLTINCHLQDQTAATITDHDSAVIDKDEADGEGDTWDDTTALYTDPTEDISTFGSILDDGYDTPRSGDHTSQSNTPVRTPIHTRQRSRSAAATYDSDLALPISSASSVLLASNLSPRDVESRIRNRLTAGEERIKRVQRELQTCEHRCTQLSAEIEQVQRDKAAVERRAHEFRTQLDLVREEYNTLLERIRNERHEQEKSKTLMQQTSDNMRDKCQSLEQTIAQQEELLHTYCSKIGHLQQHLEQIDLEKQKLANVIERLKERLEESESHTRRMELRARMLTAEIDGRDELVDRQRETITTLERKVAVLAYNNHQNTVVLALMWGLLASLFTVLSLPSVWRMMVDDGSSLHREQLAENLIRKAVGSLGLVSLFAHFGLEMAHKLRACGFQLGSHMLRLMYVDPTRPYQFITSAEYISRMKWACWCGLCVGSAMFIIERIFFFAFHMLLHSHAGDTGKLLTSVSDWLLYCVREAVVHELLGRLFLFVFVLYCLEYVRQYVSQKNIRKPKDPALESRACRWLEKLLTGQGRGHANSSAAKSQVKASHLSQLTVTLQNIPRTAVQATIISSVIFAVVHVSTSHGGICELYLMCKQMSTMSQLMLLAFEFVRTVLFGIVSCCGFLISKDIEYVVVGHLVYSLVVTVV